MTRNRIAGTIAALAMLAAPAAASAHRGNDHQGRHHAKKAQVKEVAGTVTSFTGNELTITLAGGKSYSGLVTDGTLITCQTAAPQIPTPRASRHGDGDPANDGPAAQGTDGAGGHDNGNRRCTAADLVADANVSEAKLSLKRDGASWKKVELVK